MCAVALALLAGCKLTGTAPEYDYLVTFDYNVDNLGVATNCPTQYLAVNDGAIIIEPSDSEQFKKSTVDGFYNEGWYTAVLDEEGNPTKDADGNIVLKDKWNFKTDVVRKDVTLYANFCKMPTLTVIVEGGNNIVVSKEPGTSYKKPTADINKPQRDGYTFIDYYTDETFTTKFTFPYKFTTDDVVCYAMMLEGKWTTVTNTDTFLSALNSKQSMYFDVPSGVLDFTDRLLDSYIDGREYNASIYGNGCVIKNMDIEVSSNRTVTNYSLFGNLGSKAVIKDLTFENINFKITVNATATDELKASLFASNIAQGAKIENVTFTNCSLTYAGTSKFEIDTYGYYVSGGEDFDCFDEAQLTITNTIVQIGKDEEV